MENIIKSGAVKISNQDRSVKPCCQKIVVSKCQRYINLLSQYKKTFQIAGYCPVANIFFKHMNN
jgi:hypothetical protein